MKKHYDEDDDDLTFGGCELSDAGITAIWLTVFLSMGATAVALVMGAVELVQYLLEMLP